MILLLFTTSYPYIAGGEQNFIEMEGKYLLHGFERVIVVPEKRTGERVELLPGFEVEDGYAAFLETRSRLDEFLRGLLSPLVISEISRRPVVLLRPAWLKRLIFFAGRAALTRAWFLRWIHLHKIDPRQVLLYTYWFTEPTLGLGLAKRSIPELRLVTRAHRYDLYEEVNDPPYWPCRAAALDILDAVFSVSADGADYLCRKYPRFSSRVTEARLGIQPSEVVASPSADGVYRIVSCSKLVAVKRVDLLLEGIIAAAGSETGQRFEWTHIGNGPLRPQLEAKLSDLPANLTARIVNYSDASTVIAFYGQHPIDVFVNVSVSEGTPVAIMEAISCGIPVIATDVGGNAEIVCAENGFRIPASSSPDEIANALLAHRDRLPGLRHGSLQVWGEKYDARWNYPEFVQRLAAIRG
ncbi:MAG TPA: glycosyltransferase [Anaerolineales bacterium]|nr:glycosyltransferase [Anaerolineales bacterium]